MVLGLPRDDAVLTTAKEFLNSFKTPGKLLVAVSGGSDSTGLLLVLAAAASGTGFSVSACTVDHALRAESAQEAQRVAALCRRLGLEHEIRRWDGPKPATGLQAAARMARYGLLCDAAAELGALCVVTGHTRDDQRETVAMREARSGNARIHEAAAHGLSGMAQAVLFERRCWVLRPFLALGRADIRDFVTARGEHWSDDPSNTNTAFERVRVRQSLAAIPDGSKDTDHCEERRRSSERIARLLSAHVKVHGGLVAEIDPALCAMTGPDPLRTILVVAAVLGGRTHAAGGETARWVRLFLESGNGGRMTAGRVVFDRRRGGLYLYREARGLVPMVLEPGHAADWDGRFHVVNKGHETVELSAAADLRPVAAALVAGGLIEPVAGRAAKSALSIRRNGLPVDDDTGVIVVEARIAPYDTFLPGFDRIMADEIACLFSRNPYLSPPVHIV